MRFKIRKIVKIVLAWMIFIMIGYIVLPSSVTNRPQIYQTFQNHIIHKPRDNNTIYRIATERNSTKSVTTKTLNSVQRSSPKHYDVLLNSYMNSGSTFTGRLLGFHKDSFYFYEPLWHISLWSYYRSNTTMCSIKSGICRTIHHFEMNRNKPIPKRSLDPKLISDIDVNKAQPIEVPQKILDHVYSCNLTKVKNLVQPGVTTKLSFSGHSWDTFRNCEILRKPFEKCISDLENVCRRAEHRVSKVLRMTVGGLETVLRHNPSLKVLQLFRDPRAVINSRIETKGHPLRGSPRGSGEISQSAKALCVKMNADFEQGLALIEKFPDRLRFIHYEDLTLNLDSIRKLYNYVGMTYDPVNFKHVYAVNTNELEKRNDVKEKARKTNNALWWSTYLPFEVVRQVNVVCNNIYPKLGYPIIDNVTQLKGLSKEDVLNGLKFKL